MAQPSSSTTLNKKTAVYSLQFTDGEDFILIPHDPEENDIDPGPEETEEATKEEVQEVVEHVCGICGRGYSSFYTLKSHMRNCTKKNAIIDEAYDEYTLKEIQAMQKSIKELVRGNCCYCCEENLETAHFGHIRCQDCFKSFKNVTSYRRHVSFIHSSLPKALPCGICNAKCPTKTILDVHLEAHAKGKAFACLKCGKEFTRKYHLIRHEQYSNCDPTKQKDPHKCNVCAKEFFRLDNLRQHLRQHVGDQPKAKEYNCPYCEKSFVGTTILNVHIRTHTGEKPFACDLCSKGFPSNGALRKHRRSHTGEKPFNCEVCARAFAAKEVLNRHMKTHTGVRPYICDECGKGFIQATQLKMHMFHHTGEGLFKCGKCEMQFSRKKGFTDHNEDFHCHDEKILDCIVCKITFTTKNNIITHFKDIHKKKLYKCRACGGKFVHLNKHPECTECKFCKSRESSKAYVHEHIPIKNSTLAGRKATSEAESDSQLPQDTGKRGKLKILTSKPKMQRTNAPKVEIIVQTISAQTPKRAPLRRSARKHNSPQEKTVLATNLKNEFTIQDESTYEEIASENTIQGQDTCAPIVIENNIQNQDIYAPIAIENNIQNQDIYAPIAIENTIQDQDAYDPVIESAIKIEKPHETDPGRMDDETLKECVGQLLNLLLDPDLLAGFGWPIASLEHVLTSIIRQCGHEPANYDRCSDYSTVIRENVKLLFTVVIENEAFKELLNNHTIDEVVLHILKMTCGQ